MTMGHKEIDSPFQEAGCLRHKGVTIVHDRLLGWMWVLLCVVALLTTAAIVPVGSQGNPSHVVTGNGIWNQASGLPDGGQVIDNVSINVWQEASGTTQGIVEWTWVRNLLPGGGGQTISGAPWTLRVDTLVIDPLQISAPNMAYVEGVVVNSGQVPSDVGIRWGFYVTDNGNGAGDPPDELNLTPIDGGNFIVR